MNFQCFKAMSRTIDGGYLPRKMDKCSFEKACAVITNELVDLYFWNFSTNAPKVNTEYLKKFVRNTLIQRGYLHQV